MDNYYHCYRRLYKNKNLLFKKFDKYAADYLEDIHIESFPTHIAYKTSDDDGVITFDDMCIWKGISITGFSITKREGY